MICAKNLKKVLGSYTALENLSCTVNTGSIYGLVGCNGAGKTTLLKTMAGIYKPDAGSVTINDRDVFDNEAVKAQIFFLADEHYFLPQATLKTMGGFYKGFYPNWSEKVFWRLTEIFELDPKRRLNGFSKGMQRQAAVILALSTRPVYLLLDECFDGLDPAKRSLVRQLLTELMAERDLTVVISSHNLRELEDLCDTIGVIHKKQIIYDSSLEETRQELNKYRVAFKANVTPADFAGLPFKKLAVDGRVATFVAHSSPNTVEAQLESFNPVLVQALPLTLEEIFLVEMEEKDYDFTGII